MDSADISLNLVQGDLYSSLIDGSSFEQYLISFTFEFSSFHTPISIKCVTQVAELGYTFQLQGSISTSINNTGCSQPSFKHPLQWKSTLFVSLPDLFKILFHSHNFKSFILFQFIFKIFSFSSFNCCEVCSSVTVDEFCTGNQQHSLQVFFCVDGLGCHIYQNHFSWLFLLESCFTLQFYLPHIILILNPIYTGLKGLFNYYLTLFLANFDPPCHKVSHRPKP